MIHSPRFALALAAAGLALAGAGPGLTQPRPANDAQIRRLIIRQAIATSGSRCPCPYSRTPKGKTCGSRSLYNRPGGVPMQCYPRDVTDQDVEAYRNEHGLERR